MFFYATDSSRAHTTAAKIYVITRVSAVRKSFQQSKLWFRLYGSVSNNYAVCGHTMVTHIAFVRMALPNLISQGPISWKSPALSQLSIQVCPTRFPHLTHFLPHATVGEMFIPLGLNLSSISPAIVANESFITDAKANEQRVLNAGRISYPAFTVSASEKKLRELMVNSHVAGYYWASLWSSCLDSRSTDRYAVATSSTTLS